MEWFLLVFAVFWLAWANGANDNFKGVATLYGCKAMDYRSALWLATVSTLVGSLLSIVLAGALVKTFSGKGLVPDELVQSPDLHIAVGGGAGLTVLLATFLGMPTSTTHALTGALAGIALMVGGDLANLTPLWSNFAVPLLLSPLLAIGGAAVLYLIFRKARLALGINRTTCFCVGSKVFASRAEVATGNALSGDEALTTVSLTATPTLIIGEQEECVERYDGHVAGISAQKLVDGTHMFSGAAVCFARAVNDTPKITALLLATGAWAAGWKLAFVAVVMAVAGLVQARKVAETMSHRITDLNPGQGLTANLVTAGLVLVASGYGMPVSTTHVSCGSIFGIGIASRSVKWKTAAQIAATWLTTLPMGALFGAGLYWFLAH